ncbi:hypothetical protein FB451DRAFT_1491846 [Mycena latifolia]|nr:hypothetical protein FB451DRAFT_1434645 [Mycena latifolia]KAJ7494148.1 hypothetical protein FB451DRAFT_1491846 [Mycena latifolia]
MSDDTFLPSSPSTIYSMGLDYEQSQHKQEIRDAREAEMSTEELEAAAEQRRLKRVKLGFESPNYKREESLTPLEWTTSPKAWTAAESSKTPARTPRASGVKSSKETSRAFMHHGLLDSQATSQEAVDALIGERLRDRQHNTVIDDMTSQDVLDQLDYRRQPVVYAHTETRPRRVGRTRELRSTSGALFSGRDATGRGRQGAAKLQVRLH